MPLLWDLEPQRCTEELSNPSKPSIVNCINAHMSPVSYIEK